MQPKGSSLTGSEGTGARALLRSMAFVLALAAALGGVVADAQPTQPAAPRRIGFVSAGSPSPDDSFRQGLRDAGLVEGRDVTVVARYASGRQEALPGLVAEVLRENVEVLAVSSTQTAVAAKAATSTVPIVFASVFDPVGAGLVASLRHPGGNATGVAMAAGTGVGSKWVELLREAVPGLASAAVLWNPTNRSSAGVAAEMRATAAALKVSLQWFEAADDTGLERALAAIGRSRTQGLIVAPDPRFNASRERIVRFAADRKLPAVYFFRSFVEAGGLIAYGADNAGAVRSSARYVARILKGEKPAEMPVEQPTRFELVINMRAAKDQGLALPQSLRLRASQVID